MPGPRARGPVRRSSPSPDLTVDGQPKIVPLGHAAGFSIASGDPDPRGLPLVAGDDLIAGKVTDVWVDTSEMMIRYYEAVVNGRKVLIPNTFAKVKGGRTGSVTVRSIKARHFANVPGLKRPDQITFLEEEMIMAYYGAGTLYADPNRAEPWL
jgi:photosynthetic reaction center H subunit